MNINQSLSRYIKFYDTSNTIIHVFASCYILWANTCPRHAHLRYSMAANAKEVGITVDCPSDSLCKNGSAHTSLVSSYQGRHYGTVNKGQWKANGYILHTITSADTLQGIALRYKVPVCFYQYLLTIHFHLFIHYPYIFFHPSINSFIH